MPLRAPTSSNYVPPALRAKLPTAITAPAASTKKTALKKEFAIDQTAFPSLGDTIKKTATSGTPISFSAAAAKKNDTPTVAKIEMMPGWVYIRKYQGKIQYKYNDIPLTRAEADRAEYAAQIVSRIILKNRIAREDYDRAVDIERLGDLSEFYGKPSLAEIYENDLDIEYLDNGTESSDYDDGDTYYD